MATRHGTRAEAIEHARSIVGSNRKVSEKVKAGPRPGSASVEDGVPYIPSDEFAAAARRVAQRRSGLLKRLAE